MKILPLSLTGLAALGLAACQANTDKNEARETNGAEAVEQRDGNLTINTDALGDRLENAAQDVGNFAGNVGNSLENGAQRVVNEVREETRDVQTDRPAADNRTGR